MAKITKNVQVTVEVTEQEIADAERDRIVRLIRRLANKVYNTANRDYPSNTLDILASWLTSPHCLDIGMQGYSKPMIQACKELDNEDSSRTS